MQTVSKISVANQAGFDLKFCVTWSGGSTPYTSAYPIDKTESINLTNYNVPSGTQVQPKIHAEGGETHEGDAVTYDSGSSNTATYVVTGTTLSFKVKLQ